MVRLQKQLLKTVKMGVTVKTVKTVKMVNVDVMIKPITPPNDKPEKPTFAMPTPPVHELPEFKGGVTPLDPPVYEKPELEIPEIPIPPVHEVPEFEGGVPGMPEVTEVPELEVPGMPTPPVHDVPELKIPNNQQKTVMFLQLMKYLEKVKYHQQWYNTSSSRSFS